MRLHSLYEILLLGAAAVIFGELLEPLYQIIMLGGVLLVLLWELWNDLDTITDDIVDMTESS
jgi:glutathionylspermidine synthase